MNNSPSAPTPPPLQPLLPSQRNLIIAAYVFSGLTIIPLLGLVTGIVGIILGIRLCMKGQNGHGAAAISISGVLLLFAIPVTIIAILAILGDLLKEIFSQVTANLEANPPQ
jgi:Flp pilus assembly pilin Flp